MTKFIISLIFGCCLLAVAVSFPDESRLLDDLLSGYDKRVRPAANINDTVIVKTGLALIRINSLDAETGVGSLNTWARFSFNDYRLRWDPEAYGGIKILRVCPDLIWRPDIFVYNSADESHLDVVDSKVLAVVYHSGDVLFIPPQDITFISVPSKDGNDLTFRVKLGSWTYDGFMLDLDFYGGQAAMDTTDFVPSSKWELVGTPAVKKVKYYPCCEEPYPDLTFNITVRAKSTGWFS